MPFFRRKRLFVILIGIIVLVAFIGFSSRDRQELSTAEQFLNDSVGWLQSVVYKPVKYTTDIFANIEDIKNTYEENRLLKDRLEQYKNLLVDVQKLKEDNQELRSVLNKTEALTDYQSIQASVIAQSPERWFEQVTINKGMQDGVQPNMAVITGEGMIGKVNSTSKFTSTVQLLSGFDRLNRISVTVYGQEGDEKGQPGLISGFDKEKETLILEGIQDTSIEVGDSVVSSGLGGIFPENLVIGTVEEVSPGQYGLTQTAYVTPAADLYDVDHVIVVKRLSEQPEEDLEVDEEGAQ
ncbi:rod shape-determining protein MreC [Terrihalobacillus insolitus]|uniref:rod shape-determining protein MreC n=1 Tax=Terrihalobacillus insolitus TaxID=2950438 RepID=UPI0023413F6A|nr:rod shape-determining protein MreC [Terrihalobacillus insolitus]MDC3412471.1 rod shape-determining protein MreC [Terrihalobacillus insolitus]